MTQGLSNTTDVALAKSNAESTTMPNSYEIPHGSGANLVPAAVSANSTMAGAEKPRKHQNLGPVVQRQKPRPACDGPGKDGVASKHEGRR